MLIGRHKNLPCEGTNTWEEIILCCRSLGSSWSQYQVQHGGFHRLDDQEDKSWIREIMFICPFHSYSDQLGCRRQGLPSREQADYVLSSSRRQYICAWPWANSGRIGSQVEGCYLHFISICSFLHPMTTCNSRGCPVDSPLTLFFCTLAPNGETDRSGLASHETVLIVELQALVFYLIWLACKL